jgi:prepilin signal peptidase PulO-like enzyme (type II secretory pathway)
MIAVIVCALFFAALALLGEQLGRWACANVTPFADGPSRSNPPTVILAIAAGLLGAVLVSQGSSVEKTAIAAIAVLVLVACWCSDSLCGIVPDVFSLGGLALIAIIAVTQRDWWALGSAIAVFVPFAVAAAFSHGRGMGWGDAKLVALAGAVLGAPLAFFVMALACVAAAVGYRMKRIERGPIAFAPYIAAAIGLAMPLGLVR